MKITIESETPEGLSRVAKVLALMEYDTLCHLVSAEDVEGAFVGSWNCTATEARDAIRETSKLWTDVDRYKFEKIQVMGAI